MRALVTGGGGFLGKAIVHRLLDGGAHVACISRGTYPELLDIGVECFQGDIADYASIAKACAGRDIVYHVAAKAGVDGSYAEYHRANVIGTENVLRACIEHGITKLVYTSSPSVVFDGNDQVNVNESVPYPEHFLAHYPRTKSIAERLVLDANCPELATVSLRPHLIWGPGDNHLVPRIIEQGRRGRLRILGRQENLVDSVYIDNAAEAHMLAGKCLEPGSPCAGKVYFITNGEPVPIADLINMILDAAGVARVERHIPVWLAYAAGAVLESVYAVLGLKGEPRMSRFVARQLSTAHWFDISAAKRDLGYEPAISIADGMKLLADHLSRPDR